MGKIIIQRSSDFAGILAKYNLFLDNKLLGAIKCGELKQYEIEIGKHTLYAKNGIIPIGRSNTLEVDIKEFTTIWISCESVMNKASGIRLTITLTKEKPSEEKYESLEKLHQLKEKNVITEEEYEEEKKRLLGN